MASAAAYAHPNIALIKYWGNADPDLRIPANGSISFNLDGLHTKTTVTFDRDLKTDQFSLNGAPQSGAGLARVSALLDRVRRLAGFTHAARVDSANDFPTGTGIASSAAAFAALAQAATAAAGLTLDERALSRLARTGSGSACRSIPGGFVEWQAGQTDADSYAFSFAPPRHWDLVDCVAVVSQTHKTTGSSAGHDLAETSPLQTARVASAPQRLEACRRAVLDRDFAALAEVAELDSNLMHAVMMTSSPRLMYWLPTTIELMHAVRAWRAGGLPVFYTIDAGPNVHVICLEEVSERIQAQLLALAGVQQVFIARPGGPTRLLAGSAPPG